MGSYDIMPNIAYGSQTWMNMVQVEKYKEYRLQGKKVYARGNWE